MNLPASPADRDVGAGRWLGHESTVCAACGLTLALGLFFIFVWAPHPWGWEGFDDYHQLALDVAAGRPFPTIDRPWGYVYFLAAFYRLFGDHPWIALVAQAALNAGIPWLVYRFALTWVEPRTASLAAAIAGVFSFNTAYASTQASDAVCTVIFMAALVVFTSARRYDRWWWYAGAGLLGGLAPQFRPNLILVPLLLAAALVLERRTRASLVHAAVLVACAAAALAPWIIRNYRLTRTVLPTSVHGAVQLWYGTLQVGAYVNSRAYNPRAAFETPVFDYTSLDRVPIVVSARAKTCAVGPPTNLELVYWTDRDRPRRRLSPAVSTRGGAEFEIPPPGPGSVLYYYFDAAWPSALRGGFEQSTPAAGAARPFVYFVSDDHLGDLDVHGDLLDVFDVVRLARRLAWHEPLAFERQLSGAGIGPGDLERAAGLLIGTATDARDGDDRSNGRVLTAFSHDSRQLRLAFRDGSSIVVPRTWSARVTDVTFDGPIALALMRSHRSLASLEAAADENRTRAALPPEVRHEQQCAALEDIAVNQVFYRREPHLMRRYSALAFDNIRRDPVGFARATAYRAFRLFVIVGTDDRHTAQQFSRSALVYAAATAVSATYLLLFAAGVAMAWRRGYAMWLPLALIAYVPLTIAPALTNMRYTISIQPIVFLFIAVALMAPFSRPRRR